METEVRDVHHKNTLSPMVITESGMVTLVKESQPLNALSPMEVIPCGMA